MIDLYLKTQKVYWHALLNSPDEDCPEAGDPLLQTTKELSDSLLIASTTLGCLMQTRPPVETEPLDDEVECATPRSAQRPSANGLTIL
jgi:hypothetical protein